MTRDQVLQGILDLFQHPRYLEIGVNRGVTFHRLNAMTKIAVDPKFLFEYQKNSEKSSRCRYFEVTSDEFFGKIFDTSDKFDVIYLDGLHTAEQTLRDLMNSLDFISDSGIIVLDDTKPESHMSSISDFDKYSKMRSYLKSHEKAWMGDVYKVVFFVQAFCQQLSYATVKENHGQTVIWRGRREAIFERKIEEVGNKSFEDFVCEIDSLNITPYDQIVSAIRMSR